MSKSNRIQVFEHTILRVGENYGNVKFERKHFDALAKLNQFHDNKYFTLLHKAIKFCEYVGVIQVDNLVIEILPKVDSTSEDKSLWQSVLINMLKVTKKLKIQNVGEATISKQHIHLLDIYFEWYLNEVQDLIRKGLIKKYYNKTGNVKALKGKFEFAGHLQRNLIHKERFYTTHQVYDTNHQLHQILNQALSIVEALSKGNYLYSKCKTVQLDFPDTSYLTCTQSTFERLKYNRKNAPYQTAIEIARIIILNFAPNVTSGSERLIALLFDMNKLWEEYVLACLKKASSDTDIKVQGQRSLIFWNGIKIRPDIVIKSKNNTYVIDTKWKNQSNTKVTTNDLRQMYVYNDYWGSCKSILLYPSVNTSEPKFIPFEDREHNCAIGTISVLKENKLHPRLGKIILDWFKVECRVWE